MTFVSVAFLFFFVGITAGYYLCPSRFRWAWLLLGSCLFYAAFVPKYIFVLFFLIGVDFFFAKQFDKTQGAGKKGLFIVSLVVNIGVLFVFKYFNFFNENISALASALHWNYSIEALALILPLGLSFHTFQSLSYLIEVYRGKYPAERHLGIYALYVMFFPQLVAGPIERPAHLIPQLTRDVSFEVGNLGSGLRLMAWGYFKKLVIADRLAVFVNYVYADIASASGLSVLLAMFAFALQLYGDFSGYTDIARGSARVLGIDLVRNFDQPYLSRSITEFWRRWHVSLSSWFRDYVYLPLVWEGRERGVWWTYGAIIITFVLTGVWHGAAWTYVVMGLLFGCYIVAESLTKPARQAFSILIGLDRLPRVHSVLQIVNTFVLVSVTWVFFRAPDLTTAFAFLRRLFVGWDLSLVQSAAGYLVHPSTIFDARNVDLALMFGFITVLFLVERKEGVHDSSPSLGTRSLFTRSFLYSSLVLAIVLFGLFTTNTFIYFQF